MKLKISKIEFTIKNYLNSIIRSNIINMVSSKTDHIRPSDIMILRSLERFINDSK